MVAAALLAEILTITVTAALMRIYKNTDTIILILKILMLQERISHGYTDNYGSACRRTYWTDYQRHCDQDDVQAFEACIYRQIQTALHSGLIPKERERLARSIGDVISRELLNRETLKATLLSESMKGTGQQI